MNTNKRKFVLIKSLRHSIKNINQLMLHQTCIYNLKNAFIRVYLRSFVFSFKGGLQNGQ